MACKYSHESNGPTQTELMHEETAELVLSFLENAIDTLDITGGAPKMNPIFRTLVIEAKNAGRRVIVRINLTIFY